MDSTIFVSTNLFQLLTAISYKDILRYYTISFLLSVLYCQAGKTLVRLHLTPVLSKLWRWRSGGLVEINSSL